MKDLLRGQPFQRHRVDNVLCPHCGHRHCGFVEANSERFVYECLRCHKRYSKSRTSGRIEAW